MVFGTLLRDKQKINDSTGKLNSNSFLILKRRREVVIPEEGPTKIVERAVDTASDVFIFGDSNYGIFGTNKFGDSGFGGYTMIRVVNPNNIFHEHFAFDTFIDKDETTATIDLINQKITI